MASSSRPSGLALPTPATGQACIATGIGAQSGTYITHPEAFQCYPTIDKPLAVTHGPEAALVSYHALLELPELKHSSFARIGDGRPHLLPSPHTPNCRTHYRRFDHRDTAHLIRDRPPTAHSVHRPNSRQDGVRQRRRPERRWNPRRHGQIEEGRGQPRYLDHGGHIQGWRDPRCRLENNDRCLHRQPSDGQADPSCRYHLVLPLRLGSRHPGRGRYRTVPAWHVCHAQRQAPDHTDGRRHLPGDLLRQQGPFECRTHYRRLGRAARRPGLLHPPGWLTTQAILRHRRLRFDVHLWIL